ncbi:MAG: hypothetical protein AB7U79_06575 [Candidatus Izemoplasmatales bacterium]
MRKILIVVLFVGLFFLFVGCDKADTSTLSNTDETEYIFSYSDSIIDKITEEIKNVFDE